MRRDRSGVGLLLERDCLTAHRAELRVGGEGAPALGATDHRRSGGSRPAAIRAEVRTPDERRPAGTASRWRRPPNRDGSRQQCVQLLQPLVESDQLVATLDQQVLTELVAAEHLEHQPAEIPQPLLAHSEQRPTLSPELAGMGEGAAWRARSRRTDGRPLSGAAETCEQRGPRHANQCNSEI